MRKSVQSLALKSSEEVLHFSESVIVESGIRRHLFLSLDGAANTSDVGSATASVLRDLRRKETLFQVDGHEGKVRDTASAKVHR